MSNLVPFDSIKAKAIELSKPALGLLVADAESLERAMTAAKEIKGTIKQVEEVRTKLVGPMNAEVKRINSYAKEIVEPLEKAEFHLKKEIGAHESRLAKERTAELKRLEDDRKAAEEKARLEAQEKAEADEVAGMFMPAADQQRAQIVEQVQADRVQKEIEHSHNSAVKAVQKNRVSGTRKVWKFTVTNAVLVPREYLTVNESAIREAVNKGERVIPGVEIFEDTQVTIR